MTLFDDIKRSARISPCGKYRDLLERSWNPSKPYLGWIMLNPSTADAELDDPTIRKCMKFARRWGYGHVVVANLYSYRATEPSELPLAMADDVVGAGNDDAIRFVLKSCAMVVAAWGSDPFVRERPARVRDLARDWQRQLHALAINNDGNPRHPLYVRDDTDPIVWFDPKAESAGGVA